MGKMLILGALAYMQSSENASYNLTLRFVTCFAFIQLMMLLPSVMLAVHNRGSTSFFVGETLLILASGFLGVASLSEKYVNAYAIFLTNHVLMCQIDILKNNRLLLRCRTFIVICVLLCIIVSLGSLIVYCPIPLIPEIAIALFCGEIAGVCVAVICNMISMVAMWYENILSW